jgi:hypothetical protein
MAESFFDFDTDFDFDWSLLRCAQGGNGRISCGCVGLLKKNG